MERTEWDVEQGTDTWRELRVGRITGSNIGAILGNNPHKSANAVLKTMVQEAHGHFKNLDHVPAIRWGNENEAVAAGYYTIEHVVHEAVTKVGFVTYGDILGASPDRYVGDEGLLEIKCPHSLAFEPEPVFKTIGEQPYYYDQIQLQMLVTGRKWTDFFQWCPAGYENERVEFDPVWWEVAEPKVLAFHEKYVEALKEPAEYLDDDFLLPAFEDEAMEMLAREYAELQPLYKRMETQFEKCEKAIKGLVTKSSCGYGVSVRVSERAGSIDYKAVCQDLLDMEGLDLEPYRKKPSIVKAIRLLEDE